MSRIRQFIDDISSNFKEVDENYIDKLLNNGEKDLFLKLRRAEVIHSIKVAKLSEIGLNRALKEDRVQIGEEEKKAFLKACLLHDLGKIKFPLNPFYKAMAVLWAKLIKAKESYKGTSRIMDVYYNHPAYGAGLLEDIGSFNEFPWLYDLIRYHGLSEDFYHKREEREKFLFNIYKEADDES